MLLRLAIAATIASCTVTTATVRADAQSSSARTITLVVVPFPAGGPTDTIGRIIAEGLQSSLGQPVIIENAPGANRQRPDRQGCARKPVTLHKCRGLPMSLSGALATWPRACTMSAYEGQTDVALKIFRDLPCTNDACRDGA
jgi:hypothetical protein